MLKKSIAFGLLAAALTIIPSTAFAGQSQDNSQVSTQEGAAIGGSVNQQRNTNTNNQSQVSDRSASGRRGRVGRTDQSQRSAQDNLQTGAAEDGSRNTQDNRNDNDQKQFERVRAIRTHRGR
jgi:hypothetical protein